MSADEVPEIGICNVEGAGSSVWYDCVIDSEFIGVEVSEKGISTDEVIDTGTFDDGKIDSVICGVGVANS